MQRRFFLRQTTTGATAAAVSPLIGLAQSLRSEALGPKTIALIDTDVSLDCWPFAKVGQESVVDFAARLREQGVVQAWAGSFDALLHQDLDAVNDRLVAISRKHSIFLPMGAVDPKQRNWKRSFERCATQHRMRGIRLHPDFHGYTLDDPSFVALLDAAAEKGMLVQIALGENPKDHPVSSRVELTKIDLAGLLSIVKPNHRIQLLNAGGKLRSVKLLADLAKKGVHFSTPDGREKWLSEVSADALHYGSHSPLRGGAGLDATLLSDSQLTAIGCHNAENLMVQV